MRVRLLKVAVSDLIDGYRFYEEQEEGLGDYFANSIYSDLESLKLYAEIHRKAFKDFHRLLSKRFPFAIYYTMDDEGACIHAIVDCRKNPSWIRKHLSDGG